MEDLELGLEYWSAVEFDADGSGYSAGHTYFTRYEQHYINVVPGALYNFINMLTAKTYLFANVNIWTAGHGKYCNYKDYFDHLLSMSKIHRCEVLHFKNDRCTHRDLSKFMESKHVIKGLFEKHCWSKIFRYRSLIEIFLTILTS